MAVPARLDSRFAFTSAEKAIDKASQEKETTVSYGPTKLVSYCFDNEGLFPILHFGFQAGCCEVKGPGQVTLGLPAQ